MPPVRWHKRRATCGRLHNERASGRDQGVQAPVVQEVGHVTTIFRMLDAGLGISVVPTLALPPAGLQGLAVRPLTPRVERSIVLVRRANRALAPVAQLAWDLVRSVAAERAGERA